MKFLDNLSGKKKSIILVILGIFGIGLILFGSIQGKKDTTASETFEKKDTTLEYITQIENKIGNITEQITGSRDVRVIVSVAGGSEFQYLGNEEEKEGHTAKEYLTVRTENGADAPILLKEIYPEMIGVSIACKGGDSPDIQAKLIRVISTAYGISSHRICIVGIP